MKYCIERISRLSNGGKRISIIFLISIFLAGCISSVKKMNSLEIGMTKRQVKEVLGEPYRISREESKERLTFILTGNSDFGYVIPTGEEYFVLLENGRVISFGKKGDFK